jgi:hypothetical protein
VVLTCVVVCALVILWTVMSALKEGRRNSGDGRSVAAYGFDLSTCLVPQGLIVASGMPRDGVRTLDDPPTLTPSAVDRANQQGRGKMLVASDRVVGVSIGGQSRAYPLRLLRWHEVVNDTVGGRPIAVTYNPLCDSVVVLSREVEETVPRFAVSGLLLNSNLLLYDTRDELAASSLWSQIQARAVAGPAARNSARLEILACDLSTWGSWRGRFPETTVLAPEPDLKRLYKRDPYHSYFGSDLLRFPVDPLPPASDLRLKDRVVVVETGGEQRVLALSRLAAAVGRDHGRWQTTVGGQQLTVDFAVDQGVAWVARGDRQRAPTAVRYAFWFAWHAAFPEAPPPGP